MEASPAELDVPLTRLLALSLGLVFIGRQDACDATMLLLDTITHDMGKFCKILLQGCAYAGTGHVLTVQKMLHLCSEHPQAEEEKKAEEAAAAAKAGGGAAAQAAAAAGPAESKTSKFLYQVCFLGGDWSAVAGTRVQVESAVFFGVWGRGSTGELEMVCVRCASLTCVCRAVTHVCCGGAERSSAVDVAGDHG